jgi:hypothetical protein
MFGNDLFRIGKVLQGIGRNLFLEIAGRGTFRENSDSYPLSSAVGKVAAELGYPLVIRPAYTLGGTGGGHVYNVEELRVVASRVSVQLIPTSLRTFFDSISVRTVLFSFLAWLIISFIFAISEPQIELPIR